MESLTLGLAPALDKRAARTRTVLLLNPPGTEIYFRDYYCSTVSKAQYCYHPVDLVYLSGTLSEVCNIAVVDAIAEQLSPAESLSRISRINPDVVLFLISSPSYLEDVAFISSVKKELPDATFIGTGDVYREMKAEAFAKHSFLDAILLDFSTRHILEYLDSEAEGVIENVIYKKGDEIIEGVEKHTYGQFNITRPRWEDFPLDRYKFPFERRPKFASVLTDFGCAFKCTFCPISTLAFKLRPIADVIDELNYLKSLGVEEIFFRDQTFGTNKRRTLELCEALKPLNLSWTCFSRVDTITEELLAVMKDAGCHTVMFGVETADEELLKQYEKNTERSQVESAIEMCRQHRIDSVGTFILGLPGDSRESILDTLEFAKKIDLDFASFNIATPRFGTTLRKEALEKGWVNADDIVADSAKSKPIWQKQELSNEEIMQLHEQVKRGFYLRPTFLFKRLLKLRSWHQFQNSFKEFLNLITQQYS